MLKIKLTITFMVIIGAILMTKGDSNKDSSILLRENRGLKSWVRGLFKKTTTTTTTTLKPTNKYPRTTAKTSKYTAKYSRFNPRTTTKYFSSIESDPFYKLKMYCKKKNDAFCEKKRNEMKLLLLKCDKILKTKTTSQKNLIACQDMGSIYCYLYSEKDRHGCSKIKYVPYIPGKKAVSTIATTKKSLTTLKTTSSSLENPFGTGSIQNFSTDSAKLKEIGRYCLKMGGKDKNCNKALATLKTKFKACNLASKYDKECNKFKVNFCTAFSKFPCCPDVLAGRSCNGKTKRSLLFL